MTLYDETQAKHEAPAKIARRLSKRMLQLEMSAQAFEKGRRYSEPEVNELLASRFEDHVFARRLLIEWGFLGRTPDGAAYWLENSK